MRLAISYYNKYLLEITMKSIVLVALLIATSQCSVSLNPEFITGFESGIFLRDSNDIYEQYGCPEARPSGALGSVNDMIKPLKMMTGLL